VRLLIWSDTPGAGGAGAVNHRLACGLARRGHAVQVAQSSETPERTLLQRALGIALVPLRADSIYARGPGALSFHDHQEPRRVFAQVGADLILFAGGSPFSNLAAREEAAAQGRAFVTLVHLVDPRWAEVFAPLLPRLAVQWAADPAVVTVSHHNRLLLRQRFGLPAAHGEVILNALPEAAFAPADPAVRQPLRQQLEVPDAAVLCLTAARLELSKGGQHLLEVARRLRGGPDLRFLWAGEGTRQAQFEALARMLGLEKRVRFLGLRSNIAALLAAADLFLLPSEVEGMPLAVMEAMAQGLPVIATAVGGSPEALGDTGLLVADPLVDREAMRGALERALRRTASDPDLRRTLGAAARQRARCLFRESRQLAAYEDLFRRVLSV
jgi:glycosyltransferase involved in cell wall biosynthesis